MKSETGNGPVHQHQHQQQQQQHQQPQPLTSCSFAPSSSSSLSSSSRSHSSSSSPSSHSSSDSSSPASNSGSTSSSISPGSTYSSLSSSSSSSSTPSVNAFLSKLWRLVNDHNNDDLISWSQSGCSFVILNQIQFARDLLPLHFKHSNMASFIRQLNMYGFRKIAMAGSAGSANELSRTDTAQFYHINFMRGQEQRLTCIKRKNNSCKIHNLVVNGSFCDEVRSILSDVKSIRDGQKSSESILSAIQVDNKSLWRDVAILRSQHHKQRRVIEKLIRFLLSLIQNRNNIVSKKRKVRLMINASQNGDAEGAGSGGASSDGKCSSGIGGELHTGSMSPSSPREAQLIRSASVKSRADLDPVAFQFVQSLCSSPADQQMANCHQQSQHDQSQQQEIQQHQQQQQQQQQQQHQQEMNCDEISANLDASSGLLNMVNIRDNQPHQQQQHLYQPIGFGNYHQHQHNRAASMAELLSTEDQHLNGGAGANQLALSNGYHQLSLQFATPGDSQSITNNDNNNNNSNNNNNNNSNNNNRPLSSSSCQHVTQWSANPIYDTITESRGPIGAFVGPSSNCLSALESQSSSMNNSNNNNSNINNNNNGSQANTNTNNNNSNNTPNHHHQAPQQLHQHCFYS